jgi:acyl carrier protein
MERAELMDALKVNIHKIVGRVVDPDIVEHKSMKDLGADSLEMVEVVSRTMKQFKIRVPRTELSKAQNIGQLLDLLERHA